MDGPLRHRLARKNASEMPKGREEWQQINDLPRLDLGAKSAPTRVTGPLANNGTDCTCTPHSGIFAS